MKRKCYICDNEKIERVFINNSGVKHYYCKRCAKKYLIKISKQDANSGNDEEKEQ